MTQLFNRIIADLGAYELIMAYVLIAFAVLVVTRIYLTLHARYRKSLVPARRAERHAKQVERRTRWAREKAEELARINRAKYVRQTLDVLPLLVAAHYAPTRRSIRPS